MFHVLPVCFRQESRNKGINETQLYEFPAYRGIQTQSALPGWKKTTTKRQCFNQWAAEASSWRNCQILNISLQAVSNMPRQIVEF